MFLLLLTVLLAGMDSQSAGEIERRQLTERRAKLTERIAELNREQEFLLFQKACLSADSKYLLLDLTARTGLLKYRNRILRKFTFTVLNEAGLPRRTAIRLTAKQDGSVRNRKILFGDVLAIRSKRAALQSGNGKDRSMPLLMVGSKDFAAIYYAVEKGTMLHTGR